MPSFCPDCGSDQIICQSCGRVMCSGNLNRECEPCNGNWERVKLPAFPPRFPQPKEGNFCVACLAGQTSVHLQLREAHDRGLGYLVP